MVHCSGNDPHSVLLYFHGGGYCSGSILSHRRLVTEAGRAAGMRTLAVDYRLAPENPFPAALDDALIAWRFLRENGIAASHIAIGGDSAGSGLTMALINRLRDADEELPACTWLVSPWLDLALSGATLVSKNAEDPIIHKDYLDELVDAYLPSGMDRIDQHVSPLYADPTGFPPTLVQVGSAETLLDDATRFASVSGAADVPVTLEIWPHMIHAWPLWNAKLEAGRRALLHAGTFIRDHICEQAELGRVNPLRCPSVDKSVTRAKNASSPPILRRSDRIGRAAIAPWALSLNLRGRSPCDFHRAFAPSSSL